LYTQEELQTLTMAGALPEESWLFLNNKLILPKSQEKSVLAQIDDLFHAG
jgi:hypothetical protein